MYNVQIFINVLGIRNCPQLSHFSSVTNLCILRYTVDSNMITVLFFIFLQFEESIPSRYLGTPVEKTSINQKLIIGKLPT